MCGGSGCTDVTDTCITSCYNELDNVTRLPPIPKKEYWTEEQKNKLANALYDLETIFSQKAKYNKQLYGFAYACFRCLPFEVPAIIAGIRNSIIHNIHTEHPTRNYLD